MKERLRLPFLFSAAFLWSLMSLPVSAQTSLSAGVWGTYQYLPDNEANKNSRGEFTDEAVILYMDGQAEDEGNWSYSSELRIGPGSFTDTANNSTGDQISLHKAWIGWQVNERQQITFGKSQVPFGWKTVNFWPGDILLAGYGDQMDVGVKLTGDLAPFNYDLAYYHADDWGSTSTDTVDDNGHWGSSTTFRKVQTLVANGQWEFVENHKLGLSLQAGKLQDLSGNPDRPVSGDHQASVIYYEGTYGDFYAKASFIDQSRDLPAGYVNTSGASAEIGNQRLAAEIGYKTGPWNFYLDASSARPDTRQSTAGNVFAFAPGLSYDYGPGWIYLEVLTQDGYVDRNGQVGEGDFGALYISFDFYL